MIAFNIFDMIKSWDKEQVMLSRKEIEDLNQQYRI